MTVSFPNELLYLSPDILLQLLDIYHVRTHEGRVYSGDTNRQDILNFISGWLTPLPLSPIQSRIVDPLEAIRQRKTFSIDDALDKNVFERIFSDQLPVTKSTLEDFSRFPMRFAFGDHNPWDLLLGYIRSTDRPEYFFQITGENPFDFLNHTERIFFLTRGYGRPNKYISETDNTLRQFYMNASPTGLIALSDLFDICPNRQDPDIIREKLSDYDLKSIDRYHQGVIEKITKCLGREPVCTSTNRTSTLLNFPAQNNENFSFVDRIIPRECDQSKTLCFTRFLESIGMLPIFDFDPTKNVFVSNISQMNQYRQVIPSKVWDYEEVRNLPDILIESTIHSLSDTQILAISAGDEKYQNTLDLSRPINRLRSRLVSGAIAFLTKPRYIISGKNDVIYYGRRVDDNPKRMSVSNLIESISRYEALIDPYSNVLSLSDAEFLIQKLKNPTLHRIIIKTRARSIENTDRLDTIPIDQRSILLNAFDVNLDMTDLNNLLIGPERNLILWSYQNEWIPVAINFEEYFQLWNPLFKDIISDTLKYYISVTLLDKFLVEKVSLLNIKEIKEIEELKYMDFLKRPTNQLEFFPKDMISTKLPIVADIPLMEKQMRLRKINKLGGGTYGRVYQATTDPNSLSQYSFPFLNETNYVPKPGQMISVNKPTSQGEVVAVKENFVSPNFKQTIGSLRELDMLNLCKEHPYCIQLKNVTFEVPYIDGALSPHGERNWISDKVFFVLEKGDMDGDKYIRPAANGMPVVRLVNERKLFAVQVLLGIEFMHSRGIYHRDLKPHNIICFTNSNGDLTSAKICDFGLTQYYCKQSMSLQGFVTLWYRAPEISLCKDYDYKVDVWSIGCILFELFSSTNRRFIQPSNDESLIDGLIEKLRFPKEDYIIAQQLYPKKITRSYDHCQQVRRSIEQQLAYTQSQISQFDSCQLGGKPNSGTFSQLVDLIENCLVVDPSKRYTISQCLNHSFFDGYRELIDQTRTLFGINPDGEWTLLPISRFLYSDSSLRTRGMQWFNIIYSNRMNAPISNWYSHQIFFHALENFDRYLILANPPSTTPESDIVVWINTFMFMSAKYFRVMVEEFGLGHFTTAIYSDEFDLFKTRAQTFEEHVVRDVFKYTIYQPTIYEAVDEFLTETSISCIIKLLSGKKIPSGTPLKNIWSMYSDELNQANMTGSPIPSSSTPVVSLLNK